MSIPPFKKISIIGLGYIGLPTAAVFASHGVKVVGVDVNQDTVDTINQGDVHIVEPGLSSVVKNCVSNGTLRATTKPEAAEAFLIAVPTPFKGDNHEPDLRYIEAAAQAIAPVLEKGNLVILESTSPVGATEKLATWLAEARQDLSFPHQTGDGSDVLVAHCPERVLPGKVLAELVSNDRIIGGMTETCSKQSVALYKTFVEGECVIASGPKVAEMAKLTENSFRDVNISFANELSIICDKLDMDVWELIRLANRHPRVNILQPGPGVGGHCIAVDPWFIVSSAPKEALLIRQAREVNDSKPDWVIKKVREAVGSRLMRNSALSASELKISVYGLAFKPDIDDLRESPALQIAEALCQEHEGTLLVVEPNIQQLPKSLQGKEGVKLVAPETAVSEADVNLILVSHKEIRQIDFARAKGEIVDTQGYLTWN